MKCGIRIFTSLFLLLLLLLLSCTTGARSESEPEARDHDVDVHEMSGHGVNNGQHDEESAAGSMSLTRAKVPSTADCIKPCKKTEDCYCEALSGKGKKSVYKHVKRNCTEGICNYCARGRDTCAFGYQGETTKPSFGYIACCDSEGSSFQPAKEKGRSIDCFYDPKQMDYRCSPPCDALRKLGCKDKDGFTTPGYMSCQGEGKYTFLTCADRSVYEHPSECGATGASCGNVPCCKRFKCESGTCVRNCDGPDKKCSDKCCSRSNCSYDLKCNKLR